MNMTDMLLQMTLQSQWQMPEIAQTASSKADAGNQTTSFHDLLEQHRNGQVQQKKEPSGTGKADTTEEKPVSEGNETEDTAPAELAAMAAGAALLANYQTQMVQAAPVQPETSAVAAPVQVIAETAGTQEEIGVQMPQLSQIPQTQPETDPIQQPEGDAQPVDMEAPAAPVQTAATTPNTSEGNGETENSASQELPQPETQRSQDEKLDTVSVESWQTPLFQKVESMPVRVADTPVDMSAPAQDVEKALSSALKAGVESGDQHLEIRLTPENLGTVVAEFTRSPEGVLHVVLHAETEQTAKLLNSHASALSLLLQDNTNSEVRVEVPQPQQSQPYWQQPDQQQQHQQQQQQQRQHTMQQESESFLHQLRLGLLQTESA